MTPTSLAQPTVAAHQECKSQRELSVHDFQKKISATAENENRISGHFCRLNSHVGRDFHGFLQSSRFAMWIWWESSVCLVRSVFFLTPSSDNRPSSSQPVYGKSRVSIAVGTISEASTGIGYYYCIYIDISIYILRRSKQQAFPQRKKESQITLWFCGVS